MPLHDEVSHAPLALFNEMSARDFDSINCEWMYANFAGPGYIYPSHHAGLSLKLADFLNTHMRGALYVDETHGQGHMGSGKLVNVFLLHPDDRTAFARQFTDWQPKPDAAEKNARILFLQRTRGFEYETPGMQALTQQLAKLGTDIEYRAVDVDTAARKVWNKQLTL